MSRRSLFRYFGTKQDVVLRSLASTGEQVRDALRGAPAHRGPWEAIQAAAAPVGEPAATAIVTAALACLDVATDRWVAARGEGTLAERFAATVAAVRGQPAGLTAFTGSARSLESRSARPG